MSQLIESRDGLGEIIKLSGRKKKKSHWFESLSITNNNKKKRVN